MKKLNLEQLELQLPKIHEKNSKILLGGTGYGEFEAPQCHGGDLTCGDGGNSNNNNNNNNNNNQQDDYSDGSYDLDYGLDDNYQDLGDYGYDQDGNVGNNGNSNGTSNGGVTTEAAILASFPPSFLDGANPQSFLYNFPPGNQVFAEQFMTILQSNSVMSNQLLGFFNNGYVQLTFDIEDIDSPAHFEDVSPESFHIRFDTDYINSDGFTGLNGTDNVGYDHSDLTPVESLVVIMAHEMLHAKHQAVWDDALSSQGSVLAAREWLIDQGYSEDFTNIFSYETTDSSGHPVGGIHDAATISDNMHEYMENYDHSVFDEALLEFRTDVQDMQIHLSGLQNDYQDKLSELVEMGNPSPEEEQDYQNLLQEVEALEAQIDYIQENYAAILAN